MSHFLRIIAVILGVVLILPGLCTLGFGGYFSLGGLQIQGGGGVYGIPMMIVGGVLTYVGWLIISSGGKK